MGNAHILGIFGRGKVRDTSGPSIPLRRRFPRRAKKMKRQSRFNVLASPLQWLFISGSARDNDMLVKGSTGRKPFRILLHFRDSAQKVSKPKAESAPIPLFFPLFPAAKLVIQTSTRRIEKLRRKKTRGFSTRRQKKLFRRYPFSGSGGAIISPPPPSGLAAAASASVEGAAAPVLRLNSSGSVGVNSPRTIL